MNFSDLSARYRPAVDRRMLLLLAGSCWVGVGLMLDARAVSWLLSALHGSVSTGLVAACGLAGVAAALLIARGFSHVARRNLTRILSLRRRVCVFAFQSWKSYILIAFMMSLGIFLRQTTIPKHLLAVLYIGIGGGLALASLQYFRVYASRASLGAE